MNVISVKDVTFSYDKQRNVLSSLNLEVPKGSVFGLLGVNGAGKTTLIKQIIGLMQIQEGDISLLDLNFKDNEIRYKKNFYYISDDYEIYTKITGREWINFVTQLYNIDEKTKEERTKRYAKEFEMTEALDSFIGTYSLGMKNKIGIMLAFIVSAPVTIMDEPLHGLDPFAIVTYKTLLREYADQGGTVFFSTHLLDIAQVLCTDIGIISEGRIIEVLKTSDFTEAGALENHFMKAVKKTTNNL